MSSTPDDINSDEPKNIGSPKYYDIKELPNLKILNKSKSLSLFHINAYPLVRTLTTFTTF